MFREDFDFDTRFDLKTNIENYVISTVDLGIDYGFGGEPLYYETMIFEKDKNGNIDYMGIDYQERYSTEEQAKEGHERAIKYVEELLEKRLEK